MAHLTLVLDNREVRKFVLNRGVTTIGRAQENDIVINNLALSRRHAQVEFKSGRFEIVDLQSQNGVFVNQERLRGPRVLDDKDAVTLGTYHFVFTSSEDSEPEVRARPGNGAIKAPARPPTEPEPEEEEEPADDPVPLLVLKYNDVELQRLALTQESCLIGRAKECDLQVAERRLSRKHCEIQQGEGGRFIVKDLGSQNGTYVNRRRIRGTYELKHGDVLNFAEYSVLFLADDSAYAGPDADARAAGRPSAEPGVEKMETVMPPAYRQESPPADEDPPIRPSELDEDPEDLPPPKAVSLRPRPPVREEPLHDPLIKSPAEARAQRKGQIRAIREQRRDPDAEERMETPRPRRTQPPPSLAPPEPDRKKENRWEGARRVDDAKANARRLERSEERRERAEREEPKNERPARPSEPIRRAEERRTDERRSDPPKRPERPSATPERRSRAPEADGPLLKAQAIKVEPSHKRKHQDRAPDDDAIVDVPDDELPERDEALNDWYQARGERSEIFEAPDEPVEPQDLDDRDDLEGDGEEPSELIPRGRSSVSRVLSTMMVDKGELDKNLRGPKTKQRKFYVEVRHGDKVLYSGPLTQAVTILGTDKEADIQLKGRYVAGRHSLLVRVRDSLLLVRLGSSSAARVNGFPKLQAFLKSGDTVQIDETTIKLSED